MPNRRLRSLENTGDTPRHSVYVSIMTKSDKTMKKPTTSFQITSLYFMLIGIGTRFPPIVVVWVAVEDILTGTLWPTTSVLFTYSVTDILGKAVSPFIVRRISFNVSFGLLTLLLVGSLLLIVVIDDIWLRIAGVALIGIANGFSSATCVMMLAYYEHADAFAHIFMNATNIVAVLASVAYTGLTTWLCVAPRIAIAGCIPLCFPPTLFYLLLNKEPLKDHFRKTTDHKPIKYSMLPEQECSNEDKAETMVHPIMSKLLFLFKLSPDITFTYITILCTHFVSVSVVSTLTFPSSPFRARDHYQYYKLLSDSGMLFGGLINLTIMCLGQKGLELFRIRKVWVISALNVIYVMFFVLASWYRFLPNVIVVLVLCFIQGITYSLFTSNCAVNMACVFTSPNDKGAALGLMQIALGVGRVAAALLGMFVEPYLREHCTYRLMLGRFCLARHASQAQWNTNPNCNA